MYTAYVLDDASRSKLAQKFPPRYSNFIGHHVTVKFGVPADTEAPDPAELKALGRVDNGQGLEALVVTVNGEKNRDDGSIYHVTWSIDPDSGFKPKDSNDLVKFRQYTLTMPVPFDAEPKVLK